jgi:hypothetical protein
MTVSRGFDSFGIAIEYSAEELDFDDATGFALLDIENASVSSLRILDQDVNVSDLPEYVQKIIDDYKHEIDWR